MKKKILVGTGCGLLALSIALNVLLYVQLKAINEKVVQNEASIVQLNTDTQSIWSGLNSEQNQITALKKSMEIESLEWPSDTYNYLVIGNSITRHDICVYWWTDSGEGATRPENDYYHILGTQLEEKYGKSTGYSVNFCDWEWQAADRDETFTQINPYLSAQIDLVVLQLGENVSDSTTFEKDYESLISHVLSNCPNATVVVVGDFWEENDHDKMKKEAAENYGVLFADLSKIKGDTNYQCGMQTVVYDENNQEHVVLHEGVAKHPGDKGMKYIADAIMSVLE